MTEKVVPLGFMLLVQRDEPQTMVGGLELPTPFQKAQRKGKVLSIPLKDAANASMFTAEDEFANVKVGDYIFFTEHAGLQIEENLFFVRKTDLIAKVL